MAKAAAVAPSAEAKKQEVKRTVYKAGNLLDFPPDLDWARFGFKWRAAEQLNALSDGYDPKQWELYKDKNGKHIRRGDLILAQMPIDLYRSMKEAKNEARMNATKLLFEDQALTMERESHEFRKMGGKVKFNFTQE